MTAPRDVSVVIPTWNGRGLLERFLPSVIAAATSYRNATGAAVELVVVDDGSRDDSVIWLNNLARDADVAIRVVRNERNLGFGAACNRGVTEARYPLVLLLNNDVALEVETIGRLAARFATADASSPFDRLRTSPLFAVHCHVLDFDTNTQAGVGQVGEFSRGFIRVHESYTAPGAVTATLPSMFASGGSSMVDRERFLELGGFDPLFSPFYFEDVELSYRAWKRGLTVAYAPDAVARHRFSSTIGNRPRREIRRISQRNRLFLNWIHLHDIPWTAQHIAFVCILFITTPFMLRFDFSRGVIAALRCLPEVRARRRKERALARRTDREVMTIFDELRATVRSRV
jgi:GT2 family glycosyltransferase